MYFVSNAHSNIKEIIIVINHNEQLNKGAKQESQH